MGRSLPTNKMRTERSMSACKDLLINSKEKSSLTRSRLRKLRRLQLLTSPSLDKLREAWQTALRDVTSTSSLLPRCEPRDVQPPLDLCNFLLFVKTNSERSNISQA